MNSKAIIQDPHAAITTTWGSPEACPAREEISQLARELSHLKSKVKQTKEHKGRISRQFKEAKDDPARFDQLKEQMASISGTLSTLEQDRKTLEQQLLAYFEGEQKEDLPDFPKRFRLPCPANDSSTDISVSVISDREAASWDRYVNAHDNASLYHLHAWKRVIEKAFGHSCFYHAARDRDDRVVGVLPLVALNSRLFGRYAVSLPFFNYGGAVADSKAIRNALMDAATENASRQGWEHIEYRTCDDGVDMPSSARKVSMILRLPDSTEALDKSVRAKVRAQFKQARRHRPRVEFGGLELLDDYYRVFARNMRDLGTPVYAKSFFRAILDELPEHCTIVSVKVNRKPAAAAFLCGYKDMLEIPWASCLREHNDYNINMWMYRQILAYAIAKRYQFFDFGRSTVGAGTYNFKKQWGAKPLQHHWYYHLNGDSQDLPGLNPDNPKYRFAIAAWQKLPLAVANSLGPRIVRNLP